MCLWILEAKAPLILECAKSQLFSARIRPLAKFSKRGSPMSLMIKAKRQSPRLMQNLVNLHNM